jgi:hypothetical protein
MLVLLGQKEVLVLMVLKGLRVKEVRKGYKEPKVQGDLKGFKGQEGLREQQDHWVQQDFLDLPEHKEHKVDKDSKVLKVLQELDQQVHLDQQGPREHKDQQDQL